MWESFQEFILDLFVLDDKAAKWVGEECLLSEKGESQYIADDSHPITEWDEDEHALIQLFDWEGTPQGHDFWLSLHDQMRKMREDRGW